METFNLHLVSDATGETINAVARACLVQFNGIVVQEHYWNLIRTKRQLTMVKAGINKNPGLVLYTFVDDELRSELEMWCRSAEIPCQSILDPVLQSLARVFHRPFAHQPGKQHELDAEYFARIAAMDFALALDDGQGMEHLTEADVILLGVSRSSKTPTCLYLANRGIKAANVPIVPECPLPPELEQCATQLENGPMLVGLTKDPDALVEIRRQRLKQLQCSVEASYIDPEKVRKEVLFARRLFARLQCQVIDVSRRSIEETAAEIMMILTRRCDTASSPTATEN